MAKELRGLPGGANEYITHPDQFFSTEGYKRNSPDVNNPYNVIPSGRITMQDVDFPILGVDNRGNKKLMRPGQEYQFPGDQVFEIPMAQKGGQRKPIIVTNKKDKRLQAYNDSMTVYKGQFSPEYFEAARRINTPPYLDFFPRPIQPVVYQKPKAPTVVPNLNKSGNTYADSLLIHNAGVRDKDFILKNVSDNNPEQALAVLNDPKNNLVSFGFNQPIWDAINRLKKTNKNFNQKTERGDRTWGSWNALEKPIGSTEFREGKKPVQPVLFEDPKELEKQKKLYEANKLAYENETGLSYETLIKGRKPNEFLGYTEKNVKLFAYQKPVSKVSEKTNFEQRIQNPTKTISNPDGTTSTHKMMSFEADGKYYAAPTIVEQNGKLVELTPDEAIDYAFKNKEFREFKTDQEAKDYANNGYKKGTPMEAAPVPANPIGTINIEGRSVPYHSEEELKTFAPYKPTQVGSSKDYTISRFESPLYWEGDKIMDKNTKKPLFQQGGQPILNWFQKGGIPTGMMMTGLKPNQQVADNTRRAIPLTNILPEERLKKDIRIAQQHQPEIDTSDAEKRLRASEIAKNTPYGSDNKAELFAARNQAIGDKFRFSNDANFFDDYLNPGVMVGNMASGLANIPLNIKEGNYTDAALAVGAPLFAGAIGGLGTKSTSQFVNNMVNPLAGFSPGEFASNVSNKIDAAIIHNPKEILSGMSSGVRDIVKYKRPFFETFPITKAQKEHISNLQNVAFEEGNKFAEDWFIKDREGLFKDIYKNQKVIRPEVEKRILDLYGTENLSKNFLQDPSSVFDVNKLLITKNAKGINSINNKSNIDYLNQKRSSVGGINADDQSITFRNSGWYYETPQRIKDVAIHEAGHSAQKIGSYLGIRPWGKETTKYSPKLDYYTSNPNTEIGREFGEAMTEPGKKYKKVWYSSPNELHSELMAARGRAYNNLVKKQGYTSEEAITRLQDLTDNNIEWLNKEYDLDRFFKPTTSIETKRKLIRALPAITGGIAVGVSQQDKKYGGESIWDNAHKQFAEGGETKIALNIYKDYVDGIYDGTPEENDARRVFNRLNTKHLNDARKQGMSPANYVMTNLLSLNKSAI